MIACSLPVARSFADTFRIPFASMSKVTSICGTPRGAGGMPTRWNLPSVRLSRAISRSPCSTWTSTEVWLSDAVEKISVFLVGIVVFRSISARHHAAEGLDAERQGRHVEEQDVLHLAGQDARLDGGADRDHLVRVHALVRLLAEELLHQLPGPSASASIPPTSTTSSMSDG